MSNPRSNAWLPLGVLAALVATSFWLKQVVDGAATTGRSRLLHDPDLIVFGFSVHQLDAEGHTRYTLAARQMVHFADDDSSNFDQIHLLAYEKAHPPVAVDADAGIRLGHEDKVLLTGKVRLERKGQDAGDPPLVLNTRMLEIHPEDKTGFAPGAILLEHGADRLEADTMTFDLNFSTAQFTRAKSRFPPPAQ